MSFTNPVSEPVLRFKSTDTGAPQINYNVRTAGDVKAVLKACLVTGYGTTASAGWTAANEVGNVIEFVSPSAAMSDYRLGIDDSTTTKTDWYYQYQDVKTTFNYNAPVKGFDSANKTHASNGWQLLVTERGLVLIELVYHTVVSNLSGRITYFGQVKSALSDTSGKNIMFFNIGHNATGGEPYIFYSASTYTHLNLSTHTSGFISTALSVLLASTSTILDSAVTDIASPIFMTSVAKNLTLCEVPPLISKTVNNSADVYGVSETLLDGRPVLSVCAGRSHPTTLFVNRDARLFLIPTDFWGY